MSRSPQIPLPISVGEKSTFENFLTGHNSELTLALKASVELGEPKLVYFYGPEGAGKSHLLFAAMRLARAEIVNSTYLSLTDPNLSNLEQAVALLEMVDVKHLVCVDNILAWAGDVEKERALFALFEQIRHAGGQLMIASENAPENSGFELPDLVSRFGSGLIYPIVPLNDEQFFAAIKLRAKDRGLQIADEAVKYLLSRSSRNSGDLFSLLDTLDQASLIEKRRITVPFLQGVLRSNDKENSASL